MENRTEFLPKILGALAPLGILLDSGNRCSGVRCLKAQPGRLFPPRTAASVSPFDRRFAVGSAAARRCMQPCRLHQSKACCCRQPEPLAGRKAIGPHFVMVLAVMRTVSSETHVRCWDICWGGKAYWRKNLILSKDYFLGWRKRRSRTCKALRHARFSGPAPSPMGFALPWGLWVCLVPLAGFEPATSAHLERGTSTSWATGAVVGLGRTCALRHARATAQRK